MRDYNFFEIYEKKKGINIQPKSTIFVCLVLLFLVILISIGLVVWNFYLTYTMDKYNEKVTLVKASEEYIEAERLISSIDAMEEYDKIAEIALGKFNAYNLIGTDILTKISSTIPVNATVNNMNINNGMLNLNLNVPDRIVAAELILNLKESNLFKKVHLSTITSNDSGGYLANVQCIMKEKDLEKEGED